MTRGTACGGEDSTPTQVVKGLLGPGIRFLQHTDLHVGFSSFNWHRDSAHRRYGKGPDWDETEEAARGPKYSVFLAYGIPNGHFARHRDYYRHARPDLRYGAIPAELKERLRAAGL